MGGWALNRSLQVTTPAASGRIGGRILRPTDSAPREETAGLGSGYYQLQLSPRIASGTRFFFFPFFFLARSCMSEAAVFITSTPGSRGTLSCTGKGDKEGGNTTPCREDREQQTAFWSRKLYLSWSFATFNLSTPHLVRRRHSIRGCDKRI